MKRLSIIAALFVIVAYAQTGWCQCTDVPTPTATATATPTATPTSIPTSTPTPATGPYLKVSEGVWVQNVSGHKWAKVFIAMNQTGEDIPFVGTVTGVNASLFQWVAGSTYCGPILPAGRGCYYWVYSDTDGATGFDVLTTDVDDPASPYSVPLLVP